MIDIISAMVHDTSATEAALAIIILFAIWMLIITQRHQLIDWMGIFKDETGKASSQRIMAVGCFVITSWVLIALTIDAMAHEDTLDSLLKFALLYVLVFSATPIASRILEIIGQVVGARYGSPPASK